MYSLERKRIFAILHFTEDCTKCHGLRPIQRRQQSLEKEGTMALKMIDTNTGEIHDPTDDEFAYRTEDDDIDDVIEEDDRPEEGEDDQDALTRAGDEIVEGGRYQHTGNCLYCGQARMIYTANGLEDQHKLDEFATMRCTCEPALQYQQRVARVFTAKANLREVAADVDPDIVAIAERGIKMIGDRMIAGITIKFGRRVLKAQGKSTGSIVVELTETTKDTREA